MRKISQDKKFLWSSSVSWQRSKNKKKKNGQDTAAVAAKKWTNWTSSLSIIQQRMNVNFFSPHFNFFLVLKEMRTAAKIFLVIPFHIISLGRNSGLLIKEKERDAEKKLEKVYEFFSGWNSSSLQYCAIFHTHIHEFILETNFTIHFNGRTLCKYCFWIFKRQQTIAGVFQCAQMLCQRA